MKIMRVILNGIMITVGNKCKQWNEKSRNYNKNSFCFMCICIYKEWMEGIQTYASKKSGTITNTFTKLCWGMHQYSKS
jgi:hypothetical protein